MEKRLMTFIAGVALSMGSALAQTSISGTVVSNEDEEPVIGASIGSPDKPGGLSI